MKQDVLGFLLAMAVTAACAGLVGYDCGRGESPADALELAP